MRRSPILALSLFVSGSLFFAACTQDFGIFGSGQTGGSGGTTTSSTTTGGTGGVGGCSADSDCNDTNPCTDDSCNTATGKCTNAAIADGPVPGLSDTKGDCEKSQCTNGAMETVADDADKPSNMDPCITRDCNMGSVQTTNVPNGTSCGPAPQACDGMGNCVGCMMDNDCPAVGDCQQRDCDMSNVCSPTDKAAGASCSSGGGNVCDGSGVCVECVDDGDCNGSDEVCNATHQCVSSCNDGMENGNETDQDCGGPCDPCGTGKKCGNGGDCDSLVCTGGAQKTCKAPACDDNVTNGAETDQDCGGAMCPKCPDGDTCAVNGDCTSGHCIGTTCVAQCLDGVKDGTETDVDCGGTCTANCALGKGCLVGGDCTSTFCNVTTKLCVVQCADGVKQANEADIDCGGAGCTTKCADGKNCTLDTDCTAGFCNSMMKCAAPTCSDMEQNGTETDVDCGGTCTTKCANTKSCVVDADCTSATCIATVCYPATCENTTKDGTETDIDCGGGACPKCAVGKDCLVAADCASGTCNAGTMKCM